jgi:hypothetical protein
MGGKLVRCRCWNEAGNMYQEDQKHQALLAVLLAGCVSTGTHLQQYSAPCLQSLLPLLLATAGCKHA